MPWRKTAADRRRDAQVYGDPVYRRNRELARRRAAGTCEECQHRHPELQCDHNTPVSQGGTHHLSNLVMRCYGDDSCKCHERKTAAEGGGYRRGRAGDPEPTPRTNW